MSRQENSNIITGLPEKSVPWSQLKAELEALKASDFDWKAGRLPAYTYYLDEETLTVQADAYASFIGENALGAGRAFKSLSSMLDDIFAMALPLYNAPAGAVAAFTSGGTESVFQAVKAARDKARADRGEPRGMYNIVTPETAHPCLNKAGELLDVEIRRVAFDSEYRGDLGAIEAAIDADTIMLYGSAPCFCYGVFDPIAKMSDIARTRGLLLHVDACWGGMLSPFAKKLGYPIPQWDFSVPGVTSISSDIHKFGYAAKGASLIMFRDAEIEKYQRFEFSGWPKGTYATPTFLGSKPGGSIASAWAVMQFLGEEGYLRAARETMDATMGIIEGINKIPGLKCLGSYGESNLVLFVATDPSIDLMAVAELLEQRGWFRGRNREPLGIQQGVNPAHLPVVQDYLDAVVKAIADVRKVGSKGLFDERSY